MRSPALAVAWEFRHRHRWGLMALSAYLIVLAIVRTVIIPGQRVHFESDQSFALVVIVPLTATFLYFLAVFSFGVAGDLAARQSMYPTRMFTLPVTTGALAGWPMLYGTVAMAALWFGMRFLALWPPEVLIPVIWPALLAAVLLAWTQALTWLAYPLRGMRVIVTVVWLTVIDAVVMTALQFKPPEWVMLAMLAPNIPLAYFTARFAVGRARRGDVPDWRGIFAGVGRIADVVTRRRGHFASARSAQAWFEWRQYGRSLPTLVAILLPFELWLLFVFRQTPEIVLETLVVVLLTPAFMAAFVAPAVGKSNPQTSDFHGVTPFLATRPLTNASLIRTKFEVTVASTLATWLLVVIAIPLALRLSGTTPVVMERARALVGLVGVPRAVTISLLGLAALLASTWKQLVQSLYIGMSGREWAVKTSMFVTLALLAVIVPVAEWVLRSRAVLARLWMAFPSIVAVLVCVKLLAAAAIAVGLHEHRLLSGRTLITGAVCWDIAVFATYGLLAWIVPELIGWRYVLALVAILEVPLARLAAAPLALAWNRHR